MRAGRGWRDDDLATLAAGAATGDVTARRSARALIASPPLERRCVEVFIDELARHAADGSAPATELLIEAIDRLGLARPGVRRVLIDDDEVDDALQDVLLAVAQTIGTFRGESRFTTWLHQVAQNKAVACLRRRREPASIPDQPVPDAGRISSIIAARTTVVNAVASLPARYRDAVVLRDLEGLSYAEVAAQLRLPLNTARTRIARGRTLVAARLAVP